MKISRPFYGNTFPAPVTVNTADPDPTGPNPVHFNSVGNLDYNPK